jgi:SPP1 family predicted phage head-tail adaptor
MAKCDYKPAAMKHRVTLQESTITGDSQGGFTESWADTIGLWAQITPLKGWELMRAQQLQTTITHKITIRYRTGITTAMRFLLDGTRILQIKQVIDVDEAHAYLEILCVET